MFCALRYPLLYTVWCLWMDDVVNYDMISATFLDCSRVLTFNLIVAGLCPEEFRCDKLEEIDGGGNESNSSSTAVLNIKRMFAANGEHSGQPRGEELCQVSLPICNCISFVHGTIEQLYNLRLLL